MSSRAARTALVTLAVIGALAVMSAAAVVFLDLGPLHIPSAGIRRSVSPLPSVLPTITIELPEPVNPARDPEVDGIKVATFLGDDSRRFYGIGPVPDSLNVIWRANIGSGLTGGTGKESTQTVGDVPAGMVKWSGTGWTGQPALVRDGGRDYLLIGGFDHNLVKLDAETGEELWAYAFDDVIKGSPCVFPMPGTGRLAVVVGSRRGFPRSMGDPSIAPVRCVDFDTGEELWRLPVPRTRSYSRDADSSPFFLGGTLYVAVESGHVYAIDPSRTEPWGSYRKPVILAEQLLLGDKRAASHGGNLVLESSPSRIGETLFAASGAGHVYGLRLPTLERVWDYWIGSDLDGSPVTTSDGHILQAVEKQYIPGNGGVLKLDPRKDPADALFWFFPTGNRRFVDWQGGVIGSVSVNDEYSGGTEKPALAAFTAIDGNLYVVSQDETEGTTRNPQGTADVPKPKLVFKDAIGGAISTPIMVDDAIIAAGYDSRVHLYRVEYDVEGGVPLKDRTGREWRVGVREVATFTGGGNYESTPIVWRGRVYIGSRDGWLYCLGKKG